ncbi:hypothetical protein G6F40_017720 [Rhizopus arrhizus]|nr:hypothetical protein G6F40_017720 [Rhizopus arrhizus]KAG1259611.1 hypothetical protein G6F65_015271 [Rhizopus arrhizus]
MNRNRYGDQTPMVPPSGRAGVARCGVMAGGADPAPPAHANQGWHLQVGANLGWHGSFIARGRPVPTKVGTHQSG